MRKAEHRRTDAFEVWSLGQQARSNQSTSLKKISPEYSCIHWKA